MFAAGTLSDKTFGFPYLAGGRHGNYRREDTGSVHNDTLNDTCTPSSEELDNRLGALWCSEEYREAVREEIERSNCVNEAYDSSGYEYEEPHPCAVFDERDDVNVRCSEGCATNQYGYLWCKYLGEEQVQIFSQGRSQDFSKGVSQEPRQQRRVFEGCATRSTHRSQAFSLHRTVRNARQKF